MKGDRGSDTDDSSSDADVKKDDKPFRKFERAKQIRQLRKAIVYLQIEKKKVKRKGKKRRERLDEKTFYPLTRNVCREVTKNNAFNLHSSLQCRQLQTIKTKVRKTVLQQDWESLRILVGLLCTTTCHNYMHLLVKATCLLLFVHPNSNLKIVQDFIRLSTGYILDEDVNKYIRILFALRKSKLALGSAGHVLKARSDKVVYDPEYALL